LRLFWYDLFILSCIYLDVILVLSLLGSSLHPFSIDFSLLVVPAAFCIIAGSALFTNQVILREKTQKPFRFKTMMVVSGKKKANPKKAAVQRKVGRPLQTAKPKVEFGFHTCPVHGVEKCAGNYLDLHSCNETNQVSSKQIFWKEITPQVPVNK
jgi:hypothetical protein